MPNFTKCNKLRNKRNCSFKKMFKNFENKTGKI